MRKRLHKTGLNSRERNYGLTKRELFYIFQGIVLPLAIEKEKESIDTGKDLGVTSFAMANNMLDAMIEKYGKYTKEEQIAFKRLAKEKYEKLKEDN